MGLWQFIKNLFTEPKTTRRARSRWKETEKPKRPYLGHCEAPGCSQTPSGLDVYCCTYCEKYHCSKHRLPENHECTGHPISPPKRDVISYSWHNR